MSMQAGCLADRHNDDTYNYCDIICNATQTHEHRNNWRILKKRHIFVFQKSLTAAGALPFSTRPDSARQGFYISTITGLAAFKMFLAIKMRHKQFISGTLLKTIDPLLKQMQHQLFQPMPPNDSCLCSSDFPVQQSHL